MASLTLLGQSSPQVRSEITSNPLIALDEWHIFFALFLAVALLTVWSTWSCWRDRNKQSFGVVTGLLMLRYSIIAILLFAFLNFENKQESVTTQPSTVAVLVDNSLSMNLSSAGSESQTRFAEVIHILQDSSLWDRLCGQHQIVFYCLTPESGFQEFSRLQRKSQTDQQIVESDKKTGMGFWFVGLAIVLLSYAGMSRHDSHTKGLMVLSGIVVMLFALGWIVLSFLADGKAKVPFQGVEMNSGLIQDSTETEQSVLPSAASVDELDCDIPSSPIVESVDTLLNSLELNSLAAVWILTDGVDTENGDYSFLARRFKTLETPVIAMGFGSSDLADNVAIVNPTGPRKTYRNDPFSVSAQVVLRSDDSQIVTVAIEAFDVDENGNERPSNLPKQTKELDMDPGEPGSISAEFKDLPAGKFRFKITANELVDEVDLSDNFSTVDVEVVDKQAKVMLFAGGPSREYKFLRDQLDRDPNIELHVLLQSADIGSDQDSDVLLSEFPAEPEELETFDCMIAFDPDWTQLSAAQTESIRQWVSQESGGLIVVAGPVNTPVWASRPRNDEITNPIHRLYPVSFYSQASGSIRLGRFGGEESFPLAFTRASSSFDFLQFDQDPLLNQQLWEQVKVFGYYAVNDEKAGAEVIAHFSDPLTGFGGKQPIYMASHLYGSGRVFFQASGELWRTRGIGPEFFEKYYTRLIRWTSQGRLLRDDSLFSLTVDKSDPTVGEFVNIRVVSNRKGRQTLNPELFRLSLSNPSQSGSPTTGLQLRPMGDSQSTDILGARYKVGAEGLHRLELMVVGSLESGSIQAEFRAKLPNAELKRPLRDDTNLKLLADAAQGRYLISSNLEKNSNDWEQVSDLIQDRSFEVISPMASDKSFKQKYHFSLFTCLFICLALGWIIRRLNQLA